MVGFRRQVRRSPESVGGISGCVLSSDELLYELRAQQLSRVSMSGRRDRAEAEVIRSGPDVALAPGADHVARAVLVGAQERPAARSEERRVGKECRSRWSP